MKDERTLEAVNSKIVQWHYDKGIIDGATDQTQCNKMLEEMIELFCACHPEISPRMLYKLFQTQVEDLFYANKFKTVSEEDSQAEKVDAVGDMNVVGVNILERNKVSLQTCLNGVYDIISKRTGSVVKGSFVKEAVEGELLPKQAQLAGEK